MGAIAQAILYAQQYYFDSKTPLSQVLDRVMEDIKRGGLDALAVGLAPERLSISGDLAELRWFELAAAINRLRVLRLVPIA